MSGPDVYVSGNGDNNHVAQLWKNGVSLVLGDGRSALAANQVLVSGTDLLVAGAAVNNFGVPVATCWKNGVPIALGSGTNVSSAFSIAVGN